MCSVLGTWLSRMGCDQIFSTVTIETAIWNELTLVVPQSHAGPGTTDLSAASKRKCAHCDCEPSPKFAWSQCKYFLFSNLNISTVYMLSYLLLFAFLYFTCTLGIL